MCYSDAALNNRRTHLVLKRLAKFIKRYGLTIYVFLIANISFYDEHVHMTVVRTMYLVNQS